MAIFSSFAGAYICRKMEKGVLQDFTETVKDSGSKGSLYNRLCMRMNVFELKVKNWSRYLIFQNFLILSKKHLCNLKL